MILAVSADKVDQLKSLSQAYLATLKNELAAVEKNLALLLEPVSTDVKALTKDTATFSGIAECYDKRCNSHERCR